MAKFQPGQPRPAGAGRKPGGTVRATVASICAAKGFDPAEALLEIAQDTTVRAETRVRAASELLQYIHPKKRSIEQRFVDEDGNDREMLDLASVRAYMQAIPD